MEQAPVKKAVSAAQAKKEDLTAVNDEGEEEEEEGDDDEDEGDKSVEKESVRRRAPRRDT